MGINGAAAAVVEGWELVGGGGQEVVALLPSKAQRAVGVERVRPKIEFHKTYRTSRLQSFGHAGTILGRAAGRDLFRGRRG